MIFLTARDGSGFADAPVYLSPIESLTATNSGTGDIVLTQISGSVTVGTGGWTLSNAGGDYIIEAQNVTVNSGGPASGSLFLGATSDITVDPSGYANTDAVVLTAYGNVNVDGDLTAGTDLALFAGAVNISSDVNSVTAMGNTVSVAAGSLNVIAGSAPARLVAATDLGVIAGQIMLQGGSGSGASAELRGGPGAFNVATSGNVLLNGGSGNNAYALIYGNPDVGSLLSPMSVGGVIQMNTGTGPGAYARMESASATSIFVDFTSVPNGGYFVNGVEGRVYTGDNDFLLEA